MLYSSSVPASVRIKEFPSSLSENSKELQAHVYNQCFSYFYMLAMGLLMKLKVLCHIWASSADEFLGLI